MLAGGTQVKHVSNKSTKKGQHADLKLREYQRYLVDRATQQENIIICAPSGKNTVLSTSSCTMIILHCALYI